MNLAIFDLDNTLLSGDSDYLWGKFLCREGLVNADWYEKENLRFYDEYRAGTLDIYEFLEFSLQPLAATPLDKLQKLHRQFMQESILPIISDLARGKLEEHRQRGETLMIITATNRFVTEPIAAELGVSHLLATDPEMNSTGYTGKVSGIPCFREGKVERLKSWLKENGAHLSGSYFYSDSHNDLPLLELVNHPVAVDPDDTLQQHAEMKGWPIISLRQD